MAKSRYTVEKMYEFVGKDGDEYPIKGFVIEWSGNNMYGEYVLNYWPDGRITATTDGMDFSDGKPVFLKTLLASAEKQYPEENFDDIKKDIDKIIIRS